VRYLATALTGATSACTHARGETTRRQNVMLRNSMPRSRPASEPGFDSRQVHQISLHFTAFRPALWPTRPSIHWVSDFVCTRYCDGLDGPGSNPGREMLFYSPQRPDRLWDQPFRRVAGAHSLWVKETTHFPLMPRSTVVELYLHSLKRLHGIVLN
jgi:hypothetical protein